MPRPVRRRAIDASRMSHLVARPGIDTRRNICVAQVVEVIVDPAEGIFIDVDLLPGEERETVQLTGPLAGSGFGFVCPVYADDLIVVGFPDGDPDAGPVLLARLWNAGDPPPEEAKGAAVGQDSPGMFFLKEQVLLRAKGGENILIRTSAAGGFDLEVEGDGPLSIKASGSGTLTVEQAGSANVEIKTADGQEVVLQDGTEPFVRGDEYSTQLDTFLDALNTLQTAVGTFATAAGSAVPALATPAATLNTAIGVLSTAITTFKNSKTAYLSTKIKGD